MNNFPTLTPAQAFEKYSEAGRAATRRGEFKQALAAYMTAREIADSIPGIDKVHGERISAADLNIAMVLIQMGKAREGEEGLREILLRTASRKIAFSASYNLATSLRKQGRHDRALRYATRAMDYAQASGSVDQLAVCHSLRGNILLSQNYLDQALEQYLISSRLRDQQEKDTRFSRAILLENIGYCHLMKNELETGIRKIYEALDLADQVEDNRCRAECLQDLCYGYLLLGRHREALEHGCQALSAAKQFDFGDIEENCHYLLGEVGTRTSDFESRDEHFEQLQQMHPELPFLRDFLCAVDVTSIITLKR
jgi:tetratricopeptide (TPR) repeat protein